MEVLCMNGRSIAVAKALTEAKEKGAETLQVPPDAVKILHQGEVFEESKLPEHGELLAVVDQARLVLGRHWARMEILLRDYKSRRDEKETLDAELDSWVRRVLELQPLELDAKAWPCWREDFVVEMCIMLDHVFRTREEAIEAGYQETEASDEISVSVCYPGFILRDMEKDLLALDVEVSQGCSEGLLEEFGERLRVWQQQNPGRELLPDLHELVDHHLHDDDSWSFLERELYRLQDLFVELPGYDLESTCPRLSRRETWESKGSKKPLKAKAQERRRTRKPERALKNFHGVREGC